MTTTLDYDTLAWDVLFGQAVPGQNEQVMVQIECLTGRRILAWMETQPDGAAWRTRIQALPFQVMPEPYQTEALRNRLWQRTAASQWIGIRNATSPNSLLWQFAVLRLSAYLNTGQWNDESVAIVGGL